MIKDAVFFRNGNHGYANTVFGENLAGQVGGSDDGVIDVGNRLQPLFDLLFFFGCNLAGKEIGVED
jgi:hypothetical protein